MMKFFSRSLAIVLVLLSCLALPGALCRAQSASADLQNGDASCPPGMVNSALADQPVQCAPGPAPAANRQQAPYSLGTVHGAAFAGDGAQSEYGTGYEPGSDFGNEFGEAAARRQPMPNRDSGPALSEFDEFARDAAGYRLPVYGRRLFDQVPTTFAPMDRSPVPADYVLGPGDRLLIRVWGKVDLNASVTVDRNGQIFLPKIGALAVAGLRYDQVESYLQSAIGNLFKGFELNVTMGQLRSIQIFVLGSARRPGVYTVSALSTLVDALFASGGPSATGSMRRIELRRDGKPVTEFDLYDLLRRGDKSKDARLLPGDVIYIPPAGAEVAMVGSVNEPGIYELKGQTTIASAIEIAGGLTSLAETNRAVLERVEDHSVRRVDEFPLDAAGEERTLEDGDVLRIFPISPQFGNAVTLRGSVARPGRYPWRAGMRISDLIPNRDALLTRNYWVRQNWLGADANGADDSQNDAGPRRSGAGADLGRGLGKIQGATLPESASTAPEERWDRPSELNRARPASVLDQIAQSSEDIDWDYASIERRDGRDLSTHLIAFHLGRALDDPASEDNRLLKPGDIVTIYTRKDIALPEDQHASFVRVDGEVNAPGVYRIEPGETLRNLVARAGGLTPHAYLYASRLTRAATRQAEEEQLRLSIDQMRRELLSRSAAVPSLGANGAGQQARLAAEQASIAELAQVQPTGRIVLDMKPGASTLADIPGFPLEDGDSFYIPARLDTVQVSGAVYNANAFRYRPGKRLSAYLEEAGGPTRQADRERIYLIRADGTVVARQSHDLFSRGGFDNRPLLPGDAIIVPLKLKSPGGFMQQLPFFSQMLSQTALTGAVVGTTY